MWPALPLLKLMRAPNLQPGRAPDNLHPAREIRSTSVTRALGPDAGSAVMATGIVSVAMRAVGAETLSLLLLVITASAWVLLSGVFLGRLCFDRGRWRREAAQPAALTAVAATSVLGARLTLAGWTWLGWAMLVIASGSCLVLLVLGARVRTLPRVGAAFLVVVAPQSLAVLAATLGHRLGLDWPAAIGLLAFAFGLRAYGLVLRRFDFDQLRTGTGDQWVAGGALAISALAFGQIAADLFAGSDVSQAASVVLWGTAIAWLPALIITELRWPRPRYDVRRWATVFPLGMYSVMSFAVGGLAGATWISDFGRASAWVALAALAAAAFGSVRRVTRAALRGFRGR